MTPLTSQFPSKPVGSKTTVLLLALALIIGAVGWGGLVLVERTIRAQISHNLHNSLTSVEIALSIWTDQTRHDVQTWSENSTIQSLIVSLSARSHQETMTPKNCCLRRNSISSIRF